MNGSREEVQAVRAASHAQSAHPALEAAHVAPTCPSSVLLLHKKHLRVLLPVSPVLLVWGLRLCSQLKESRDPWQENVLACSPHWHVERPRPAMAVVTFGHLMRRVDSLVSSELLIPVAVVCMNSWYL